MKQLYAKIPALMLTLIVGLFASSTAFGSATIVIENGDAAGVGFNDTTAVAPVGGNNGTTLGQQRLNAFQFAANVWGATLTSGPTITIRANWSSLGCSSSSVVLGQAGNSGNIWRDFPGSISGFWYGNALANALSNTDRNGSTAEIVATFNTDLGTPSCTNFQWYYGLDTNPGAGSNLVTVLLHEFAHGLGFQTFTNRVSGAQQGNAQDGRFPSIYDRFLLDKSSNKTWPQMTDTERVASAINTNNLVWNGPQVTSDVPAVLAGTPRLRVNSPAGIARNYQIGTADFGAALATAGVTANVVQAVDQTEAPVPPSTTPGTTNDGCSPLANAAAVSGKIALIDRGFCTFVTKAKNAQNAGAIGVIIVNNVAGSINMTGVDPTITIPIVSITLADGNTIKAQLASGVNASLLLDTPVPTIYTPNPLEGGSSVSHWDTSLFPNQLMEPNASGDLTHSVTPPQDLTFSLMKDIGWPGVAPPPPTGPANNNFANAQVISGCTGSVTGTNIGANKEANEPSHEPSGDPGGASVWYQWQAPSTGSVTITTLGSNFDTVLAVYTGNSVGALIEISKNDDVDTDGGIFTSAVTFNATSATLYKIAVDGFDNDRGNIVLNWTQSACSTASPSPTPSPSPGASPEWQPVVLTAQQIAEIKAWTTGGTTSVYLKAAFPNAGYRVANWGQAARAGNDFTADAAVEKFTGASVQAVTTTAQIYDLGPLANGTYNFNFKTSGTLTKTLQFTISSTVPPPNSIDDARQFVKQQYRDFLNREADQAGEDFWTDNITKCNDPARRPPGQTVEQCTLRQRETTSGAFFLSPEFQYTGYFVYRMYQGGLGRQPKLSEFIPDTQFVGNGIIVNNQLSGAVINQNKAAFAAQFVNCTDATKYRCAEFKAIYDPLNNTQYVDKLFQTTGVNASASDRTALVNGLNGGTETRATVLQKVVDGINVISEGNQQFTTTYGQAFYNAELNRVFVLLEYFGYMKRDPDDAGYAFWLGKLNQFGGDFVNAEMVLAFISSPEYRARFGQP
jgi:hypothetical protein